MPPQEIPDELYLVVWLDAIVLKIRDQGSVRNKHAYLAIGVGIDGIKETLGISLEANEGAKFWLRVISELKARGVEDILVFCGKVAGKSMPPSGGFQRMRAETGREPGVGGIPHGERDSVYSSQQGRQDSNLQPPVLETGALPIAPRPWAASGVYPRPLVTLCHEDATLRARRALLGHRAVAGADRRLVGARGGPGVGGRARRGCDRVLDG